jgi:ribosomal protein S18 acetylase RimI-like enzyme
MNANEPEAMQPRQTRYMPITKRHLPGIMQLCSVEGWKTYSTDPELTWKALTAPGVYTVVAEKDGDVVGFAQLQSDGVVQAHLSLLLVAQEHRRQGIGSRLISDAFKRSGAQRIDLITEESEGFYRSLPHKECFGFRIYPTTNE